MGIKESKVFVPGADHHETAAKYQLSQAQSWKIFKIFKQGDKDGSNELDAKEFNQLFGEEESAYLQHLFTFMDIDQNAKMNFPEFLMMVSSFCLQNEDEMTRFCFTAFDKDDDGVLDLVEMEHLRKVLTAQEAVAASKAMMGKAMDEADKDGDGQMTLQEFEYMNLQYPNLLWPAFRLQYRVQEATLGNQVWARHAIKIKGTAPKKPRYGCQYCICLPEKRRRPAAAEALEQEEKKEDEGEEDKGEKDNKDNKDKKAKKRKGGVEKKAANAKGSKGKAGAGKETADTDGLLEKKKNPKKTKAKTGKVAQKYEAAPG